MTTYESFPVFREPCCLFENCSDGTLKTCSDVLNQLSEISSPLNVVAITGPYRSGKSYLLNHLAGKQRGFLLGSTIEATTKGIWVWCRQHPERPNEVLLLMDTEGLGDINKGNEENDNWIFALSVLLSSTLVYNCKNVLDQDGLTKLHFREQIENIQDQFYLHSYKGQYIAVILEKPDGTKSQLSQRIKTTGTSGNQNGDDFYRIFPNFVWVVRDFFLKLEKNGQPITSEEYLADALELKKGTGKAIDDYNRPRQCITQFFEAKKCFIFPMPVKELDKMAELERLSESELNPKFLDAAEKLSSYIYTETFPKTASGQPIHGKQFCNLLENYVSAIQKGEIPCVEDAVKNMAEKENANALKVSVNVYITQMNERLISINNEHELSQAHLDCSRMALERFMSMSKLDEKQKYQSELKMKIGRKFSKICRERAETMKDQKIAELNDTTNNLNELQRKLKEEKQNVINELDRKIRQREDETKNNKEENKILKQQLQEMKRERELQEKDLRAIHEGGSSFAKFLHGTGSVLITTLKVALVSSGVVVYVAGRAAQCAVLGTVQGGGVVGGVIGGVIGLGVGIIEAVDWICNNLDKIK